MALLKNNKIKYALAGALFGCCFPIMAVSIDILRLGLSFSWADIVYVQSTFPIHLIINTAPIFLGLFALIGGVRQDRLEDIYKILQKESADKESALKETTAQKDRMEKELNVAKDIQLSMLPLTFPPFPHRSDIDIYAQLLPAREVGGDFYDFYFLDEDHLCFVIGDVSGKGVPAALFMAVCKTLLKSTAGIYHSTAAIFSRVNNELAKENKNCMFVTAFMGIINTKTGLMTYSNAGHCPTYIKKKNNKEIVKLAELHGPVLAAVEGKQYKESTVQLDKNDLVFAYTDGITEAHNFYNDLFSDKRLENLLGEMSFENAEKAVNMVVQAALQFEEGTEPFDDIAAIGVRYI